MCVCVWGWCCSFFLNFSLFKLRCLLFKDGNRWLYYQPMNQYKLTLLSLSLFYVLGRNGEGGGGQSRFSESFFLRLFKRFHLNPLSSGRFMDMNQCVSMSGRLAFLWKQFGWKFSTTDNIFRSNTGPESNAKAPSTMEVPSGIFAVDSK